MKIVRINGRDFETEEEVHAYLSEDLGFPSYYGKNLSALYDCLTELSDDTRIILDISETEEDEMIDYLQRMAEVISDAVDASDYLEMELIEME